MASTTSKQPAEGMPAPVFSYAQAAKGRATSNPTSTTQTSHGVPDVSTAAKDLGLVSSMALSANGVGNSESDEHDVHGAVEVHSKAENDEVIRDMERRVSGSVKSTSIPASPSSKPLSSSTLPKDEDNLSRNSNMSDTAGENDNTQEGIGAAEQTTEAAEGRRGKRQRKAKGSDKGAEKDKEDLKSETFIAAPVPVVNVWQQRKEAQAAKAKPSPSIVPEPFNLVESEKTTSKTNDSKRRGKSEDEKGAVQEGQGTSKGQKKASEGKLKEEASSKKVGPRGGKANEKDSKPSTAPAPPPVDDAISWPTPETALIEERRRSQDKAENKHEKEGGEDSTAANKPRQKKEWVAVPFTPSVTFNTPLPPGRGRGRVGVRQDRDREGAGRGTHAPNTNATRDRLSNGPTKTAESNEAGEKRSRGDSGVRAASLPPNASKRVSLGGAPVNIREQQRRSGMPPTDKTKTGSAHAKGESSAQNGRHTSTATQTDASLDNPPPYAGNEKDAMSSTQLRGMYAAEKEANATDRRGETNFKGTDQGLREGSAFGKDNQQGRDRGEPRSDRGRNTFRGRNLNFMNGQHPQHAFPNGQGVQANGAYLRQSAGPYSPPLHQPFSQQFAPLPTRGDRVGPRANSIPNNAMYGGRFNPSGNAHQIPPLQTSSTMYEYPQVPQTMSAIPYNPYVDQYSVLAMVTMQFEYYFSIDNLCKDVFLRKHMDSQGFVFLTFIAGFKRIQALSQDFELLRFACQESSVIEIVRGDDGIDRLRRAEGWEKWVLAMEERDESVRNAGPTFFHRQMPGSRPQMGPIFMPGQPSMSPQAFSPNPNEGVFVPYGNGNGHHHLETPLSAAVPEFAPGMLLEPNQDPLASETTFTDAEAENLMLVFTSPKGYDDTRAKQTARYASSRTFSNGSIDGRSFGEDTQDADPSSRSRPSER